MNTDAHSFLIKQVPFKNVDKFWYAVVADKTLFVFFGRNGTKGQHRTKEFKTKDEAVRWFMDKTQEKLNDDYVDGFSVSDELNAQVQKTLEAHAKVAKQAAMDDYAIEWANMGDDDKSEEVAQAIRTALPILNQLAEAVSSHVSMEFRLTEYSLGPQIKIMDISNNRDTEFGFFSDSEINSWNSTRQVQMVREGTKLGHGYLNGKGKGTGSMTTDRGWVDIFVRALFEHISKVEPIGLADKLGIHYFDNGFYLDSAFIDFQWYHHWKLIEPIFIEHGILRGVTGMQMRLKKCREQSPKRHNRYNL